MVLITHACMLGSNSAHAWSADLHYAQAQNQSLFH